MKKFMLLFVMIFVLSVSSFCQSISTAPFQKYLINSLGVLVDKTMEGYNLENYVDFYRYFANKMDSIVASRYFKALYVDVYKKDLGYLESKKLLLQESVLDPGFPVLVYECKFENFDKVLLIVNFIKEEGAYRITQVRLSKVRQQ